MPEYCSCLFLKKGLCRDASYVWVCISYIYIYVYDVSITSHIYGMHGEQEQDSKPEAVGLLS